MSWESTHYYYRVMNEYLYSRIKGFNSIEAVIYSVNFARIEELVERNEWEGVTKIIIEIAQKIESAGATFLIMTANAIHKIADEVQKSIGIPLLHIADPTGIAITKAGMKKVGFLGTKVTMGEEFYRRRMEKVHGIEVVMPDPKDQEEIHKIIFEELVVGKIVEASRQKYKEIIEKLGGAGVEGVILGCTEINLLIGQRDTRVPLFDTTELHAKAAVDMAL